MVAKGFGWTVVATIVDLQMVLYFGAMYVVICQPLGPKSNLVSNLQM